MEYISNLKRDYMNEFNELLPEMRKELTNKILNNLTAAELLELIQNLNNLKEDAVLAGHLDSPYMPSF